MRGSNKTFAIIAGALVIGAILHIEYRVSTLADKVDTIAEIINDAVVEENTNSRIKYTPAEVDCLTKNIYYEAGVESRTGKYAVGHVTMNRLKSGKWGNNVCQVVYAKKQFSWTLNKKLPKPNKALWNESREIAIDVLNGSGVKGLDRSMFYHADYIKTPKWASNKHYVGQIGQHKFYNQAKKKDDMI